MNYRSWTEEILRQWPEKRASTEYRSQLNHLAATSDRLLHLGCGYDKNNIVLPLKAQTEVIGVDMDERAGAKYHSQFWLANAQNLPFADSQFDLVCTEYLFEHVENPAAILREVQRVLTAGGTLIILTPNLWSYKFMFSAITPYSLHKIFGRYRYQRPVEEDMFPTLYRANTPARLVKLFAEAGLVETNITLLSNGPTWFRGMPILFELGCLFHKLIESPPALAILRCAIIAVTEKVGARQLPPTKLRVQCVQCKEEMSLQGSQWRCKNCGNTYAVHGNVTDVYKLTPDYV